MEGSTPPPDQAPAACILVAARCQSALRILATCHALGLRTLAVSHKSDALHPHVRQAGASVCLAGSAPGCYTDTQQLLQIIREHSVTAVHPGDGHLSEDADFSEAVVQAGAVWLGPSSKTLQDVAQMHVLARDAGVPVLASGSQENAYAGTNADPQAGSTPPTEEVHHIDVQIFGDGEGNCVHLGERESSVRQHDKQLLEEAPSPSLDEGMRARIAEAAVTLGRACCYRSAGTVKFCVDARTKECFFRSLQPCLESGHVITEMTHRQRPRCCPVAAPDSTPEARSRAAQCAGGAEQCPMLGSTPVQAYISSDDPAKGNQPSVGEVGCVHMPSQDAKVRMSSWVSTGSHVSSPDDSLLACVAVWGQPRQQAVQKLGQTLRATKLQGISTNLQLLRAVAAEMASSQPGATTERFLNGLRVTPCCMEVIDPGMQTSIQDWPGRTGLWHAGVPTSGPMDCLAHRMANALVGNDDNAAGMEFCFIGPTLRFHARALIALTGARFGHATLDGQPLGKWWQSIQVSAGQVLSLGTADADSGLRGTLAVLGGFDVPVYLGSRATLPGKLGGHQGRFLQAGDTIPFAEPSDTTIRFAHTAARAVLPLLCCPSYPTPTMASGPKQWEIGVLPGPHADSGKSESEEDGLYAQPFAVNPSSSRMGVHLEAAQGGGGTRSSTPDAVTESRADSTLEYPCPHGAVLLQRSHLAVISADGPTMGRHPCIAVVASSEIWKLGQLRPGDSVVFKKTDLPDVVSHTAVAHARMEAIRSIACGDHGACTPTDVLKHVAKADGTARSKADSTTAISCPTSLLHWQPASEAHPGLAIRLAGERCVLVEYGEPAATEVDLRLCVRIHSLEKAIHANEAGILQTSSGLHSCLVEYDVCTLPLDRLLELLQSIDAKLPPPDDLTIPSRIVRLPLAFGAFTRANSTDPSSDIESIAQCNALQGKQEACSTICSATFLVLGLGSLLGSHCAVALDPRHRLRALRHGAPRTAIDGGAVGIGGTCMYIHAASSPSDAQLLGRTLPLWDAHGHAASFHCPEPWLLQCFDQLQFFPVSEQELEEMQEQLAMGRYELHTTHAIFDMAAYVARMELLEEEVSALKAKQKSNMAALQEAAHSSNALPRQAHTTGCAIEGTGTGTQAPPTGNGVLDSKCLQVLAPFAAKVLRVCAQAGAHVAAGDTILDLGAMQVEIPVTAPAAGTLTEVIAQEARDTMGGSLLAVLCLDG